MVSRLARFLLLVLCVCMVSPVNADVGREASDGAVRERINIDKGWRFAFGHADDPAKDFDYGLRPFFFAKAGYGDGPANALFNDAPWRELNLPHDWAVELPFDRRGTTNRGSKAIGHAFPENSVGWYRKTLEIPAADQGKRISLEFDGVYRNSVVWVNGHYLGTEPSGYSGFRYDITDYVNFGGPNLIAVRVDATTEEGWYYEGAGIYRHVWLTKTSPLHVAQWGTFVKAVPDGNGARVEVDVTVANDGKAPETFGIEHQVLAPDGSVVGQGRVADLHLAAASSAVFGSAVSLPEAVLWTLENPHLYRLRTTIRRGSATIDTYETPFGVRTVAFDPERGFSLNGQNIKLQGTNNHQDHAGVGMALPDGLQDWRIKQLKSFGVNAYRTSHHPPTPELLEAADRLGMLVIDEHRMMGTTPEIRGQLERLIRRDRNHPSVIIWSLGNEEWALEWSPLGTRLATEMDAIARHLDPTRRTMVAASGSGEGVSLGANGIGFNYGAQHDVDAFHGKHPDKPAMMSEEGSTLTTRGIYIDDRDRVHLNAYDRQGRPGLSLSIEEGWTRVAERPWMSGMFVWTGFDYRGEPTPFGWPAISSQFGMLDTTGAYKDTAYYLKSVWTPEPMVHILPHWNWTGREGQPTDVRAYSNADEVELYLNGASLGRQKMTPNSHLRWNVPYAPGTLAARAYTGGQVVATSEVETTGAPANVSLTPDKARLRADGEDVAIVWVNVTDERGRIHPTSANLISFAARGPIRIIGVGNGDPGSHEADRPAERHAFVKLGGWRSLAVDTVDQPLAVAHEVDTSSWRDPFVWLPPERQPPASKALVLRGTFSRPALGPSDRLQLFIDRLHPNQKVYLNGREVRPSASSGSLVIDVTAGDLAEANSLTYVFETPESGVPALADKSVNGSRWGLLRVSTPAAPWQRHVFNGRAQVILQSTGEPGQAALVATSPGLAGATALFEAQ